VYGKSIGGGARNYTKQGKVAFRLFDVVFISNFEELLALPADQIARWRDNGGEPYVDAGPLPQIGEGARLGAGAAPVGSGCRAVADDPRRHPLVPARLRVQPLHAR